MDLTEGTFSEETMRKWIYIFGIMPGTLYYLKGLACIHTANLVIKIKSVADKANFLFLIHANQF